MKYVIQVPELKSVSVQLPASKSISNRALILTNLSGKPSAIKNLSDCDDTEVMINAFSSPASEFNIKAAGTAMRFLTAYLSQQNGEWIITGTERMKNRPIRILVDALRQVGAHIEYLEKDGYPPLKIFGKELGGGEICLNGNVSSQYISALMMVAPLMLNGLTLKLEGEIISKPYINLTTRMMSDFGVKIVWSENVINILPQVYKPVEYTVESDWSAASYWYQIAALAENEVEIELLGLYPDSMQGDSRLVDLFAVLGVATEFTENGVKLRKTKQTVTSFVYDFVNEPDLAQTFVVTCALKNIPFRFTGLQSLKIKETDRIKALQTELSKLGYLISDTDDSILEWNHERCPAIENPSIDTYEDHRMAMAFAPVALVWKDIIINEPEVVTKSYPYYWKDLEAAGFVIRGK